MLKLLAITPVFAALISPGLAAQHLIYKFTNPDKDNRAGFGGGLGSADVNGDGYSDVLVGAPSSLVGVTRQGKVFIYSGRDGALIRTLSGSGGAFKFGGAVSGIGDVDGDKHEDFAVSAATYNGKFGASGRVRVYSGKTFKELYYFDGFTTGARIGGAIRQLGDVDGDKVSDFITGPLSSGGSGQGFVEVRSGKKGTLIKRILGQQLRDYFGRRLCAGEDLDGDGVPDLVVGAKCWKIRSTDKFWRIRLSCG